MRHSDTVAVLLRELGQQLAALRREAGLTQENLGVLAGFSRSTVSVAEIGRQPHAREFWAACDKALDSSGVLAVGFDQIEAVHEAEERAAACAAQEAREARPGRHLGTVPDHGGGDQAHRPGLHHRRGQAVLLRDLTASSEREQEVRA